MTSAIVITAIVYILLVLVAIIVTRSIFLWYFKINILEKSMQEIIKNQQQQNTALNNQVDALNILVLKQGIAKVHIKHKLSQEESFINYQDWKKNYDAKMYDILALN